MLVDEFQEVNFAQGLVLRMLAQAHRNVTVAGDDDQAIHRLRGAWAKNIDDFAREYPEARVVRLERCYRSGRKIVTAAQRGARDGRAEGDPLARHRRRVRFWRARSERAQAQAVAADVERLLTQDGVAPERDRRARALGRERGPGRRRRHSRSARSRSG